MRLPGWSAVAGLATGIQEVEPETDLLLLRNEYFSSQTQLRRRCLATLTLIIELSTSEDRVCAGI